MKNIILLGGAPAIGKTTVAQKLVRQLKIPCISTDEIRANMRMHENKNDAPALFFFEKHAVGDPVKFLDAISPDVLLDAVDEESREVWRGVLRVIDDSTGGEPFIIEGVAVLPEEAAALERHNDNVKTIILTNNNPELIRHTIYGRGLGGSPDLFSEKLKHKQIKWVEASNQRYLQEALGHGLEIFDVNDPDHIEKIIKSIS
jgi:2-phosphoglycerate kinase